jgi:hypothetical protein
VIGAEYELLALDPERACGELSCLEALWRWWLAPLA